MLSFILQVRDVLNIFCSMKSQMILQVIGIHPEGNAGVSKQSKTAPWWRKRKSQWINKVKRIHQIGKKNNASEIFSVNASDIETFPHLSIDLMMVMYEKSGYF